MVQKTGMDARGWGGKKKSPMNKKIFWCSMVESKLAFSICIELNTGRCQGMESK